MRIIAGDLKGKHLFSVKGRTTRPTSDKLRESIFSILSHRVSGSYVLDLFAGTGALGIEALSRGASGSYFIDHKKEAVSIIRKNTQSCGLKDRCTIIQWDIKKNLKCIESLKNTFDLVFMDPPYHAHLVEPALMHLHQSDILRPETLVIVEHALNESIPSYLIKFKLADQRKYGKTFLSILKYEN